MLSEVRRSREAGGFYVNIRSEAKRGDSGKFGEFGAEGNLFGECDTDDNTEEGTVIRA